VHLDRNVLLLIAQWCSQSLRPLYFDMKLSTKYTTKAEQRSSYRLSILCTGPLTMTSTTWFCRNTLKVYRLVCIRGEWDQAEPIQDEMIDWLKNRICDRGHVEIPSGSMRLIRRYSVVTAPELKNDAKLHTKHKAGRYPMWPITS
jgi:hypothetical protein